MIKKIISINSSDPSAFGTGSGTISPGGKTPSGNYHGGNNPAVNHHECKSVAWTSGIGNATASGSGDSSMPGCQCGVGVSGEFGISSASRLIVKL